MSLLANAVYHFHATNYVEPATAESPVLPLPIDALRLALRGQGLPASYAAAANHTTVNGAVAAYETAKNNRDQAFRPMAQWLVEVSTTAERGVYLRLSDAREIVLLRENGERFYLDQGLGLATGTRFVVGGFTDTSPSATRPTMEVTTVVLSSAPQASDRDEDGNLLDDEWERYFFGAIGQNPQAIVKNSGYQLLQYFLDGIDPRGDDVPTGDSVIVAATHPMIAPRVGGGYTIDFRFPDAYASRFNFVIEASTSLETGSFATMDGINATRMEQNGYRFMIPASGATEARKFFRVRTRLR
jgi:hypothetical protein